MGPNDFCKQLLVAGNKTAGLSPEFDKTFQVMIVMAESTQSVVMNARGVRLSTRVRKIRGSMLITDLSFDWQNGVS